VERKGKGGS